MSFFAPYVFLCLYSLSLSLSLSFSSASSCNLGGCTRTTELLAAKLIEAETGLLGAMPAVLQEGYCHAWKCCCALFGRSTPILASVADGSLNSLFLVFVGPAVYDAVRSPHILAQYITGALPIFATTLGLAVHAAATHSSPTKPALSGSRPIFFALFAESVNSCTWLPDQLHTSISTRDSRQCEFEKTYISKCTIRFPLTLANETLTRELDGECEFEKTSDG